MDIVMVIQPQSIQVSMVPRCIHLPCHPLPHHHCIVTLQLWVGIWPISSSHAPYLTYMSEFTPGYPWPIRSAPYDLLSGLSSCQDSTFTVSPVVLPGLQAQWCTIRVRCPNWELGTTQASLT